MAVWCGVCATQLFSATENYGRFVASDKFGGWPKAEPGESHIVIQDTCESCASVLREAVAKATNAIVLRNLKRVTALAEKLAKWEEERRQRDEFDQEFERKRAAAWRERQEKK